MRCSRTCVPVSAMLLFFGLVLSTSDAIGRQRPSAVPGTSFCSWQSYLTGSLFRQMLGRIERLGWHPT